MSNVQTRAQREADPSYRIFPENIPDELKAKDKWILWRLEKLANGKPTKVPYQARTGWEHLKASTTSPTQWVSWPVAYAMAQKERLGVGYVLDGTDDFYAVDLDAKPELSNEAGAILAKCHSYTEVSPSGRGRRIFLKGQLPEGFTGGRSTQAQIEVYQSLRYITVTGDRVNGHDTILFDQETTDEVISIVAKKKSPLPEVDWPTAEGEGPEFWELTFTLNNTGDQSNDDHGFLKDCLRVHPDGDWAWEMLKEAAPRPKLERKDYRRDSVMRAWREIQGERMVVEALLGPMTLPEAPPSVKRIIPKTARDLFRMELSNVDPSPIPGLLGTGLWTLAGPPKKGKSWLVLFSLLAMSLGSKLFGHFTVKPQPTLLYALEDGHERLAKRLKAIGVEPGPDFYVEYEFTNIQAMLDYVVEKGVKTVVVDTKAVLLMQAMSSNPELSKKLNGLNSYERETALLSPLKTAADAYGITILLVTHLRKAKDDVDPFNQVMGSVAAQAVPNGAIMMEAIPRHKELVRLSVRSRDMEENEWTLTREDDSPVFRIVSEEEVVSKGANDVLDVLRKQGKSRVNQLQDATGLNRQYIHDLLNQLAHKGLVRCQQHWWEAVQVSEVSGDVG